MPTKIHVIETRICPDTFDDSQLPTDMCIIEFTENGERQFDAVRASKKVDIFDEYYDRLKSTGQIHAIKGGYGRIKPKLYNANKKNDEN